MALLGFDRRNTVGRPMPLKWDILHDQRLVHIVAEGRVTLPEMEEHFDALAVADVLQYGKLFDATRADPIYTDEDVMAMGARLSAYTATLKSGPLAVIGLNERARTAFRRFVNISPAKRPARLFKSEAEARAWLEEVADQVDDQRTEPFHTPKG
jgi:hypothetical protein